MEKKSAVPLQERSVVIPPLVIGKKALGHQNDETFSHIDFVINSPLVFRQKPVSLNQLFLLLSLEFVKQNSADDEPLHP